ncbi:hypothetical protein KGM_210090 [Danaus plexippus plexippus]|uniref:Uncharacterized protein n=1 Tax=Danaus plexippus plexippus TaxID=278856 RepID=A0A212EVW1_DANPL|nr:hypothetical protein KGM_210090 [Danaus plexippus plexippus]
MGGSWRCSATRRSMRKETYSSYSRRIKWNDPNDAADLTTRDDTENLRIPSTRTATRHTHTPPPGRGGEGTRRPNRAGALRALHMLVLVDANYNTPSGVLRTRREPSGEGHMRAEEATTTSDG